MRFGWEWSSMHGVWGTSLRLAQSRSVMVRTNWRAFASSLALAIFVLFSDQVATASVEDNTLNLDTVIAIDVSWSMVTDLRKQAGGPGSDKAGRTKLERWFSNPANNQVIASNILARTIEVIEQTVDKYERGHIRIVTFRDGPHDLDGPDGPIEKDFEVYIDSPSSPEKDRLKAFLNPLVAGRSPLPKAPEWKGVLFETMISPGRYQNTFINRTCDHIMSDLERRASNPGYLNNTVMQRLLLFTDGMEQEPNANLPAMLDRFVRQREKVIFFEYQEVFSGDPAAEKQDDRSKRELRKREITSRRLTYIEGGMLDHVVYLFSRQRGLRAEVMQPRGAESGLPMEVEIAPPPRFYLRSNLDDPVDAELRFEVVSAASAQPVKGLQIAGPAVRASTIMGTPPDASGFSLPLRILIEDPAALFATEAGSGSSGSEMLTTVTHRLRWELVSMSSGSPVTFVYVHPQTTPLQLELRRRPEKALVSMLYPQARPLPVTDASVDLGDIKPDAKLLEFAVDLSDAPSTKRLLASLVCEPPGLAVFAETGTESLTISPQSQKGNVSIPVSMAPGAAGDGVLRFSFRAETEPEAHDAVPVLPNEVAVSMRVRDSLVKIDWFSSSGDSVGAPASLDLGQVPVQRVRRGESAPPDPSEFEVSVPQSFPPEAAVEINCDEAGRRFVRLQRVASDGTPAAEEPWGRKIRSSGRFRVGLRQDAPVGDHNGKLVILAVGGDASISGFPEGFSIAATATVFEPTVDIVWLARHGRPRSEIPPSIDFGRLRNSHVRTGNYRSRSIEEVDEFEVRFDGLGETSAVATVAISSESGTSSPLQIRRVGDKGRLNEDASMGIGSNGRYRIAIDPTAEPGSHVATLSFGLSTEDATLSPPQSLGAPLKVRVEILKRGGGAWLWLLLLVVAGVVALLWQVKLPDENVTIVLEIRNPDTGHWESQSIKLDAPRGNGDLSKFIKGCCVERTDERVSLHVEGSDDPQGTRLRILRLLPMLNYTRVKDADGAVCWVRVNSWEVHH